MTKKIYPDSPNPRIADVLGYEYPVYHTGKKCYVDFRAFDPATGKLKRKKYHLDNITNSRERARHASLLIHKLADKLASGWNPWCNPDSYLGYTELQTVLDRYLVHVEKNSRKKTIHSYTSRVNIFREYLKICRDVKYAFHFDTKLANGFLDWLEIERDVEPRTWNNYKGWLGSLAEYMLARKYIDSNPVANIKKKRELEKKRQPLTPEMLHKIRDFLTEHDRPFLLAVMMEYYTMIRPSELVGLRIRDFSVKDQSVFVSGAISKNKRDGHVGVNDTIIRLMLDLGVLTKPGDLYLFSKDFLPGDKQSNPDVFNKQWKKYRKILGWSDDYQFYSLKDSGIRDLVKSTDLIVARDQARHTDISTTNKYIVKEKGVREETKRFSGSLS